MKVLTVLTSCLFVVLARFDVRAQYVWNANFDDGLPPEGLLLRGDATIPAAGGIGNSGHIALTPATNGALGDVILPRFWGEHETPAEFTVRCSVKLSGNAGVVGDGFSISFSDGLPGFPIGEGGVGSGPKMNWDTFDNDGTDGGAHLWWPDRHSRTAPAGPPNRLSIYMTDRNDWHSVEYFAQLWSRSSHLRFDGDRLLQQPAGSGATPVLMQDGRLVIGARTGDAFNAHLFDNLSVTVTPYPIFTEQPQHVIMTEGGSAAFFARTNFNTLPWRGLGTHLLASSVTTEWQIRHPGGEWTAVPGTSEAVLWGPNARSQFIVNNVRETRGLWEGDDPAWSLDGTEIRCVLSWHNGYSAISSPAILRLLPQPAEQPGAVTLFNSWPLGHAAVTFPVEEGKVLRLTPASPDCAGGFVFDEIRRTMRNEPQRVMAFAASFQYRGRHATVPRADGISFNIAGDLPDSLPATALEEGLGSGLTVSLDAFSNGPDDPVALDIRWRGQLVARVPLPSDALFTDDWVELYVRVEEDGSLDLALDGVAVLYNLPLAAWSGIREPRMGVYGRTGSLWQEQAVRGLAVSFTAVPVADNFPELSLQRENGGHFRLMWPAAGSDGWALQQSGDLVAWSASDFSVEVIGASKSVFIPDTPGRSRLFFRLARGPQ